MEMEILKNKLVNHILRDKQDLANGIIEYSRNYEMPDFIWDFFMDNIDYENTVTVPVHFRGTNLMGEVFVTVEDHYIQREIEQNFLQNFDYASIIHRIIGEFNDDALGEFIFDYYNIYDLDKKLKNIVQSFVNIPSLLKYSVEIQKLIISKLNIEVAFVRNDKIIAKSNNVNSNNELIKEFIPQIMNAIKNDEDFLSDIHNVIVEDLLTENSVFFDEIAEFIIDHLTKED